MFCNGFRRIKNLIGVLVKTVGSGFDLVIPHDLSDKRKI